YPDMASLHRDLLRLARRLAPAVEYTIAAATDIGLNSTRTTNQDAYVYLTGERESEEGRERWAALAVSDGMGGMAAGGAAARATRRWRRWRRRRRSWRRRARSRPRSRWRR